MSTPGHRMSQPTSLLTSSSMAWFCPPYIANGMCLGGQHLRGIVRFELKTNDNRALIYKNLPCCVMQLYHFSTCSPINAASQAQLAHCLCPLSFLFISIRTMALDREGAENLFIHHT